MKNDDSGSQTIAITMGNQRAEEEDSFSKFNENFDDISETVVDDVANFDKKKKPQMVKDI
jgi:hypothetical protein